MRRKYATLAAYQPYIDIIRKDLGLPDTLFIEFVFGMYKDMGGDSHSNEYSGKVRLDKRYSHEWTVESLMHELKHIQQWSTGKLKDVLIAKEGGWIWKKEWCGVQYDDTYTTKCNPKDPDYKEYMNLPWEIEARNYEKRVKYLFPNYELPPKRIYIGAINNTKFYKLER